MTEFILRFSINYVSNNDSSNYLLYIFFLCFTSNSNREFRSKKKYKIISTHLSIKAATLFSYFYKIDCVRCQGFNVINFILNALKNQFYL